MLARPPLAVPILSTLLLQALIPAVSATTTTTATALPPTFRVNSSSTYLDMYTSLTETTFAVLNHPQSSDFDGSLVYLNNSALYFLAGDCKTGLPVLVPGAGEDWVVGETGESGSRGFALGGGGDKGRTLRWKKGVVYGCPDNSLGYYETTTLACAASAEKIPDGCTEVALDVFDYGEGTDC